MYLPTKTDNIVRKQVSPRGFRDPIQIISIPKGNTYVKIYT